MFKGIFRKKTKKTVVLGLDGVPCSLLRRFAHEGVMPNMGMLLEEGTLCSMTASIPEISSTSWSTFMTGVNPGRHGIYGFMELNRDTYSWVFPNFNDLKSSTIWEMAGSSGKRSIVLNIPSTYPARPFNGKLVSGFVALDLRKASYPEEMYHYLSSVGYRLDVDARRAATSLDEFSLDIVKTLGKRMEVIEHLFESEDWDLFIAAITETDRLHHYMWDALADDSHPRHEFVIQFYVELDRFIGSLFKRRDPDTPFILLSDHGFTGIKKEIYLNSFLRDRGYLSFEGSDTQSFAGMSSASQAFALDPSRIYIHLRDRYSRGSIKENDYEEIRASIKSELLGMELDGEKTIRKVFFKEDIYNGSCFLDAPDLVVLPAEGYDLKGSLAKNEISGNSLLTGGHTWENATFYINRKTDCGNPNIMDVGATILNMLGIDAEILEGKSLV